MRRTSLAPAGRRANMRPSFDHCSIHLNTGRTTRAQVGVPPQTHRSSVDRSTCQLTRRRRHGKPSPPYVATEGQKTAVGYRNIPNLLFRKVADHRTVPVKLRFHIPEINIILSGADHPVNIEVSQKQNGSHNSLVSYRKNEKKVSFI